MTRLGPPLELISLLLAVFATLSSPWNEASLGSVHVGLLALALSTLSRLQSHPLSVFSPGTLLMASGLLYSLPLVLTLLLGFPVSSDRRAVINGPGFERGVWLHLLALTSFAVGLAWISLRSRPESPGRVLKAGDGMRSISTKLQLVGVVLVALGSVALGVLMLYLGGPGTLSEASYGARYQLLQGLGFLSVGVRFLGIGATALYVGSVAHQGARAASWRVALALVPLVGWTLLMESRRGLIFTIVYLVVARHLVVRKWSLITLTLLGSLVLVGGSVHSVVRGLSPGESLREVPFMMYNPAGSELSAALLTTADLVGEVPARRPFLLGQTYLRVPALMVPRALYPTRPQGAGQWYAQEMYPEVAARGGAFGFSPVAEAYLNFGVPGVVGIFLMLGLTVGTWESRLNELPWSLSAAGVLYATAVPWLLTFFRLDAATLVKGYFVTTAMVFLGFYWLAGLLWSPPRFPLLGMWQRSLGKAGRGRP